MRRVNAVISACALLASLVFPVTPAFAVNSAPTVGTITPSSGSGDTNASIAFTAVYKDANGWKDIQAARFLVNISATTANCLHAEYNQNTNKLYMLADDGATYIGGFAPGSNNVIENSYAKLNCSSTKIYTLGTTLTVKWNITFKPGFTGAKNTYLKVMDDYGASDGWIQKGMWTINEVASAQFISQLVPATMICDQTYNVSVTMKNTGTTTWTRAANYKLGSQNPPDNTMWGLNRVELSTEDSVAPGQSKAFTFTVKAPAKANKYKFQFRMVRESVGWFGDYSTNISIRVIADTAAPTGTIIVNSGNQYTDATAVTLTLSATDVGSGLSQMKFSNNNSTWSAPESYATTKSWILTTGDGTKTVYVKYKDAAGNWSVPYSDTIIVQQTLSISVEPNIWDIGSTEVNQAVTMGQDGKITVTNNGTGTQTYELKLIDPTGWTASTIVGNEQYVLSGIFCGLGDIPQASSFSRDAINEDVITQQSKKATNTVFCYSQGTANGTAVSAGSARALYLQFISPTITAKKDEQIISVIVSCQVS